METIEKIYAFFNQSLNYFGKEIALPDNRYFSIDKIIGGDSADEYNYLIQYGFPQSAGVTMRFGYSKEDNFNIRGITVYAPPEGEDIVIASYSPQGQIQGVGISVNIGLDTGAQSHSSIDEIERNSNASKVLDMAISDLERAEILGECNVNVENGSNRIPCCVSAAPSPSMLK